MAVKRFSDEEFAALKAKAPGAVLVPTRAGDVVLGVPSAEAFAEFMRDLKNGNKDEAGDRLVRVARVAPSAEELDAMMERKAGIVDPCLAAVLDAAGLDAKAPYSFSDDDDSVTVVTCVGPLKFRSPTRIERKAFKDEREDPKRTAEAMMRYVSACAVDPKQFVALAASRPGLVGTCYGPLEELAGSEVTAQVKK